MTEKVIGYFLLAIGVGTVLFSTASIYLVFTKKAQPVKLFNYAGISIDPSSLAGGLADAPVPKKPAVEIISGDMINESSNLVAHIILMSFISGTGFKLASLGVQMIRPIVVKLKAKDGSELN